jgi:hypothetical protein
MTGRIRHQLGVLFLILLVALVAWGCGGGGDEETTTTGLPVVTAAPSGPEAAVNELIGQSVATTEDTPADFVDVYGVKPIVLLFYVPGGTEDVSVSESIDALTSSFGDYVFLVYDYKAPEAYGDLSSLLKVGYPPEVVLIDKDGIIEGIWNGYVDEGTLNQELVNLEQM